VFKEKASVIEHLRGKHIRTVNRKYKIPSIIRLETYITIRNHHVRLSKENIFKRDKYCCQYCGTSKQPLTIDHVVPKNKGGKDTWSNLVTACQRCNNLKGNKNLEDLNMQLRSNPKKPNRLRVLQSKMDINRTEWKTYLFLD
jgi:5-methylcytosine-specific restriction endonuclease McrA